MLRFCVASLCMCLGVCTASASGITLQVAPSGKPLASLAAARDAIRQLKQAGPLPAGGVTVVLAPGVYRLREPFLLDAQDSGTAEAPIVYRAERCGTAIVSGGAELRGWRAVNDPEILKLIDAKANGHVLWTEVGPDLLPMLPGFANGGEGFLVRKSPEYPLALYQQNARLPIARWPNEGFVMTGRCLGESRPAGHMGIRYIEGRFEFKNERLTRWAREPELWFNGLWYVPWADSKLQLKAIDLGAQAIALKNPELSAFGYMPERHFYAFNAIGEIDRPGEWAIDRARRRLYLWPAAELTANPVTLALAQSLIQAERLAHVTFDGLTLECCRHTAISLKDATAVTVQASTVRHTGGWAADITGGEQDTVIGCDLYDLGEGGVRAMGGDRDRLISGRHLIENNHIHHIGRVVACYRPGAAVYGVGNAVRHNLIYQTDHQAIFFDGNDHRIEYNIVHDVCLYTSDAGPLYACARDWSKRGTVIRHNLFHASGEGVDACGCRGIYLDDHTSDVAVTSNIVSQADVGINLGGGKDNRVTSNITVNCRQPVTLHSRGVDSFAKVDAARGRESGCYRRLLRDVYQTPLWRERYPNMLAPLAMDPIEAQNAHGNTIRNNVSAGSGEVKVSNAKHVMKTCVVEQNPVVDDDPGFVDLLRFDLRLRPDAPILKQVPGFEAPDFARMGLYDDPRRASPAVKFGPEVTPMEPVLSPAAREAADIAKLWRVDRTPRAEAVIQSASGKSRSPWTSRARLTLDGECLSVVITNDVDPQHSLASGQTWGVDDGVELALLLAAGPSRRDAVRPFVLRGYANGKFQSTTTGGVPAAEADLFGASVRYTATRPSPGRWEAQWRVPLAALGIPAKENHLPLLAQITVYRSAGKTWTTWSPQHARDTWTVRGAYALWLAPLGDLAFLPGTHASVCRVAVSWGRDKVLMQAGPGATNPAWAPSGSRIEAQFGAIGAERWQTFQFEFTPAADGQVVIELMGTQGTPTAWTYYDDFHVTGAPLVNGDFEQLGADGRPVGWRLPKAADLPGTGLHMAVASHDFRTTQPIAVHKDQKVTVRFRARAALGTP
jgi:parallel beta-helix repeat protein